MTAMKTLRFLIPTLLFSAFIACGGGHHAAPDPVITITPGSPTVLPSNSLQFKASIANLDNQNVMWSVDEANGGTITSTGLYTAPGSGGPFHVTATALGNTSKNAKAIVALGISTPINVALSKKALTLGVGQTYTFAATIANDTANQGLLWSVVESNGGTVTSAGVYTAPALPGCFHLRASAKADTAKYDEVTLTIQAAAPVVTSVTVSLDASQLTLPTSGTHAFTANVANDATSAGVWWSILEADGGTVDANGQYTAPSATGTYHIQATSKIDPSRSAVATLSVVAAGTAVNCLIYTNPTDAEDQWRTIQIDNWTDEKGLNHQSTDTEKLLLVKAPKGTVGRGWGLNFEYDANLLEIDMANTIDLSNTSYLGECATLAPQTPTGNFLTIGRFAENYWSFRYYDRTKKVWTWVRSIPLEGPILLVTLKLKAGASLSYGQILPFNVSKAGVVDAKGNSLTSTHVLMGTLKAVYK